MSAVRPIAEVAKDLGIAREHLIPYGDDKAKIRLEALKPGAKRGQADPGLGDHAHLRG